MYCLKAKIALLLAFFGCFSSPADAQINLKSGYNFSILSNPSLDRIISAFNVSQTYASGFRDLRWMHGFQAGIRFKSELHSIELTYQGSYQSLRATKLSGGQEFDDQFRFNIHSAGIGYQVSDRIFGLGSDLQYQFYKVKFIPGENGDIFKNAQNIFALKFYLMFNFKGRQSVDVSLQPYYVLPLEGYDYSPLTQYLQLEPSFGQDRWNRFGLSVLFYNGKK